MSKEILCDETPSFFRCSCLLESTITRCTVSEMCKELLRVYVGLSRLAVFLLFFSLSIHVSYSLFRDSELALKCRHSFSFRINLFCCAFCKWFPHSGPAFSHLIPLRLFTSLYLTLLLITVHGATHSLPRRPSPLGLLLPPELMWSPSLSWSRAMRQMVGEEDIATNHRPLDLHGSPLGPPKNL